MVNNCVSKAELYFLNVPSETAKGSPNSTGKFGKYVESFINNDLNVDSAGKSEPEGRNTGSIKEAVQNVMQGVADNKVELSEESDNVKSPKEMIMYTINQMTDLIKKLFSLSDEELNKLMEDSQISSADLLTDEGLAKLFEQSCPQKELLNLLTDSESSAAIKEIFALVKEVKNFLSNDFSLDGDSSYKLLQDIQNSAQQLMQGATGNDSVIKGLPVAVQNEGTPENLLGNTQTGDSTGNSKLNSDTGFKVIVETEKETEFSTTAHKESSGNSFTGNETAGNDFAQTFVSKISEIIGDSDTGVDASRIIKQIVEQVKITVNQEASKMEMQLYPEHLGKLGLEIISKEGALSAQFTVANQGVKEAIESNLPFLKNSLENQGIKVESVEVTIASHQFEQNLSDNGSGSDAHQNKKKKFINLDELGPDTDMQTIEQLLEEQLMQFEGNSVSFRA